MSELPPVDPRIRKNLDKPVSRINNLVERLAVHALPAPDKTPAQYIRENVRAGLAIQSIYFSISKALCSLPSSSPTARTLLGIKDNLDLIRSALDDAACSVISLQSDPRRLVIRLYYGEPLETFEINDLIEALNVSLGGEQTKKRAFCSSDIQSPANSTNFLREPRVNSRNSVKARPKKPRA